MLRIHQIFILKFLILFVGTILVTFLISYVSLKNTIIDHTKENLQNAAIVMSLNLENVDDLDSYANKVKKNTNLRVTIIDDNGLVIAESNTDKSNMDNHLSRYELMNINQNNFSNISRYSKTLKADFLYVAMKYQYRGKKIYIRLSKSLEKVMDDFYSLWFKLALVFLVVIIIAFYICKNINSKIVYDMEQITKFLDEIYSKNYSAVIKTKYFYEFLQISLMLKNLVKKLYSRDKQKRKHTAKIELINKQRNDMLLAISHEFKNPVASIVEDVQTLQKNPDINLKNLEKFLVKINSNGENISNMLERLELFVKLDNDDLKLNIKKFDMKKLCEKVITNISSKYKGRNIVLKVVSTIIQADKSMMELVLTDLIDNALKYSQSQVDVVLIESKLYVIDNGIGIEENNLKKISSMFYKVKKNTKNNSMGIGLTMVNYILKMHKSKLEITSTFAKGSTFSFSIKSMLKKSADKK